MRCLLQLLKTPDDEAGVYREGWLLLYDTSAGNKKLSGCDYTMGNIRYITNRLMLNNCLLNVLKYVYYID